MSVTFCVAAYLRRTRRRHARCLRNCIPKTTSNASPATWKSGCDASFFFILFVPRKFVRFLIFRLFDFRHRSFVVFPQLVTLENIPYHTIRECPWDYVFTFPEALYIANEGYNVAQAINFVTGLAQSTLPVCLSSLARNKKESKILPLSSTVNKRNLTRLVATVLIRPRPPFPSRSVRTYSSLITRLLIH